MRRLAPSCPPPDPIAEFLRLRREARGLTHLRAHLPAAAKVEDARRLLRRLRGIGRRPSGANGETPAP